MPDYKEMYLTLMRETEKAIRTLKVNEANCRNHLEHSLVLVTALAPVIGYDQAAKLQEECGGDMNRLKEIILERALLTKKRLEELLDYRNLTSYMK